jgi:imidazolonepropionase-like amidohydrolase
VATHALGSRGILAAIDAGVASIEHGFELPDAVIERMLEADVVLVPTLSAIGVCERIGYQGLAPELAERAARYADLHRASVRRFYRAGGRIALGTDAGTPLNHHGANVQELGFLTELGVAASDALRAATRVGADLLGLADRGRLVAGAAADLLLVEGDIATDLGPIVDRSRHRLILKDGRDVRRELPASSSTWAAPLPIDDAPF